VADVDNGDDASLAVDPLDNAIGAAAGAVPVVKRREQPLANPVRLLEQRTGDELKRGDGYRIWQGFGKCSSNGRRRSQDARVRLVIAHSRA
jgi:hypothetical protein